MKKFIRIYPVSFLPVLLLITNVVFAQFPGMGGGGGGGRGGGQGNGGGMGQLAKMNVCHVYGTVIDSKTKKPVEFASAALLAFNKDSAIAGMLTSTKGEFSLENLPFGTYRLRIAFLGYKNVDQQVKLSPQNPEQDLGKITIEPDQNLLGTATVTGEKQNVQLAVDRKVFNVDKDISSRGGTGMDVIKNVPGVSVDDQGNVTLRNNSPLVYVDGKPTTLTLDQIPSDQIDRIEVITNPSAKFEAAASGGIINVVMKHNEKPGYNGLITANIGTNNQYNGLVVLNIKEKKYGFGLSYTINGQTNPTLGYDNKVNNLATADTAQHFYNETYENINKRTFQFLRLSADFYISNHNTFSLSANGVFGNFTTTQDLTQLLSENAAYDILSKGTGTNTSSTAFQNYTANADLKHTYTNPGQEWDLTFSFNHINGLGTGLDTSRVYDASGNYMPDGSLRLINDGDQHADQYTAQWDYSLPLPDSLKLEFGARANYTRTFSDVNDSNLVFNSANNSFTAFDDSSLSSRYRIDNLINAAYVTIGQHIKGFSYQFGLRFEESYYRTTVLVPNVLTDRDTSFGYQYPGAGTNFLQSLFPSMYLSQKFGNKHELQFNITRKLDRPNFRQITPFKQFTSQYAYSEGNVDLTPEFINQAELNYDLTLDKVNWLSSLYGRYTQMPITPVNTEDGDTVISTYGNGKSSFSYGWENTIKISPTKNFDITLDGSVFYTTIQAIIPIAAATDSTKAKNDTAQNSGWSYNAKIMLSYKLPQSVTVQLNANYQAPKIIPQGTTSPVYFLDFAASKDFGIATLNFSISDILNSKRFGYDYVTDTYTDLQSRRRDVRYAKLGVTIKFGKMDSFAFQQVKEIEKRTSAKRGQHSGNVSYIVALLNG